MASLLLSFLVLASLAHVEAYEPSCPLIFDGRVPPTAEATWFDLNETPYSGFRGRYEKWSSLISFPPVPPAVFDYDFGAKPMAIDIDQDSVLRPANKAAETGHRQTTLIFNRNTGSDESTRGALSQVNCFLED